ncbi:MAG: type II toxin-antitoxin system VapC family toxin [Acidobacteria bacterium]|nr:type II toxin-antitoxin system VapC family toxin [Acidobacteriota bacterium]
MPKIETADPIAQIATVYFDSALIAKFYLNEPGRESVRTLARSAGIVVTSGIAVAEIAAAFHRKFREGAVDEDVFNALQGQFRHDLNSGLWRLIGPTEALLDEVRALFSRLERKVFLRSLDALHLVTAKAERLTQIYSNDRHLLSACASVGLEGINPISQPIPAIPPAVPPKASAKKTSRPKKTYHK